MKKLLFVLVLIISLLSLSFNVFGYAGDSYIQSVYDESTNTIKWENMQTLTFQGNKPSEFEYTKGSITAVTFPGPIQVQLAGIFDDAGLGKVNADENYFYTKVDKTNTVMLTEGEYTLFFMLNYGTYSTGSGLRIKVGNGSYTTSDVPHSPTPTPASSIQIDTNRGSYFTSSPSLPMNTNISDWAIPEVNEAFAKSIVPSSIYNEGNYQRAITRKEFAYVMVGAMQSMNYTFDELVSHFVTYGFSTEFTDTNNDLIIQIARINSIINGTSETTFSPDGFLTREEAATMLNRLYNQCQVKYGIGKPVINNPTYFADRDKFDSWAVDGINFVSAITDPGVNRLVMGGVGDDMFDPAGNITVEQALIC